MTTHATPSDAIDALAASLGANLLRPDSAGYEEARRVQNGLIDRRPALIARCRGTADVVDAIRFARAEGLEVAVRGGGHNVAGRSVCDGGVMIDLSAMQGMQVVPSELTAVAQGGVNWRHFNRETQVHGLATTGGVVGTTGVGGLTLGGGLGFLMGTYGMTVDNLLSAEVVTADGEVLTASQQEHPDLFWALRGGGGNFGVVTSFEFRVHRVGPTVTGGLIAWPFDAAGDVLRFYREFTASAPDAMTAFAGVVHAPDGSGAKLAAVVVGHSGPADQAAADLAPLKAFGTPAMDMVGPIDYCVLNSLLDDAYPKGMLSYWKANFLSELSDDAIDGILEGFAACPPSGSSILLEHFHGAACRVGVSETAFAQRSPGYNCGVFGDWTDRSENDRIQGWVRTTFESLRPHMREGRYVNYLGGDESAEAVTAAYGPNLQRLREIKSRYDPTNFFHLNQNIRPL